MPMVKIANVKKQFSGNFAINNVSLQIEKGEFVGILGPSGCGKTTLLRLIAGLETPDAGTIEIDGELANNPKILISAQKRQVGMVFQDLALWPHLTVEEHLQFVLKNRLNQRFNNLTVKQPLQNSKCQNPNVKSSSKSKIQINKVVDLLKLVKLQNRYLSSFPHQLSGGERQRLAIARSLAQDPKILLLDEPFANLDTMLKKDLQDEIKKLHKSLGTTLIYVTHEVQEIKCMIEQLIIMQKGEIVQEGNAEEVYNHPKNELVSRLLE